MKRFLALTVLLAALTASVAGCSGTSGTSGQSETPSTTQAAAQPTTQAAEQASVFKAGEYTASADGNNGPVTVSVTFSDSAITDVKVTDHAETPNISDEAITAIPADIVTYQSIAVDAVSGATRTSDAILAAVADCVAQAGADPEQFRIAIQKTTEEVGDRTATVDVLVIGGGGTGLTAAMSAIDNGAASVMVVEKMSRFGGSTAVSGAVVAAENTYYTDESGFSCDSQAWLADWKASSDADIDVLGKDPGYPTYDRVSSYFDQVSSAVNWLEDLEVANWVMYPLFPDNHYQVPDYIIGDDGADPEGGYMLTDHMVDWLTRKGADLRLKTSGIHLLTNEAGDVIGATVEDENGSYDVYTNKGVVLATGGFAASEEMMREYLPQFADWIDLTTSGAGDTGDGIKMAEEVGGVMYNDPYVITLGSTSRNGSINSFCMSVNLWSRMVVNSSAKRFFNEGYMPYQCTVELSRTEDGVAWALGDSSFAQADLLDAAVDGVEVVKADTIEELAKAMGVDSAALSDSVTQYNAACASGKDEAFGKDAAYLNAIETAPYYAVRIYVCTGGTIGGVKTNADYQVIREDGSVINGLYAGGETSNREMYAYAYSSGSGVGYAIASGKQIGINIMK